MSLKVLLAGWEAATVPIAFNLTQVALGSNYSLHKPVQNINKVSAIQRAQNLFNSTTHQNSLISDFNCIKNLFSVARMNQRVVQEPYFHHNKRIQIKDRERVGDLFNDLALGEIIESETKAVGSGRDHRGGSGVLEQRSCAESEWAGARMPWKSIERKIRVWKTA